MLTLALFLFACAMLALGYYLGIFTGAPYVPSTPERIRRMLDLANLESGARFADFGSGDGRLLVEAAKRGAYAIGYEINPLLVLKARRAIRVAGVSECAQVFCRSFWRANLADFDVIAVYGVKSVMERLEKRLETMSERPRIVSNGFPFPNLKGREEDRVFVYD